MAYQEQLQDLLRENCFEEALQLVLAEEQYRPGAPDVLAEKAALLGTLQRFEEAIAAADEAIAADPSDYNTYHNKGVDLYELDRYSEALCAFDACLALKPNLAVAIKKKISCLIYLSRFEEAAQLYEDSDLPELSDDIWHSNLGFLYLQLGRHDKAVSFLSRANSTNPYDPITHYNLAYLRQKMRNPMGFLWHRVAFLILTWLTKVGILDRFGNKRTALPPHIMEASLFIGSGRLYSVDSQEREIRAILKLIRGPYRRTLCNDTYRWFAINIPYDAAEANRLKGDIDIIVSRPRYIRDHDAGFTYRGFQVKTILAGKTGATQAEKRGPRWLKQIKKQLDVLKEFGCEQVYLLELYILERGYSKSNRFPPLHLRQDIVIKADYLRTYGYGYAIIADEPLAIKDDESAGVLHHPIEVLTAVNNPIGRGFQILADTIDAFHRRAISDPAFGLKEQEGRRFVPITSYCYKCKDFTLLLSSELRVPECPRCGRKVWK